MAAAEDMVRGWLLSDDFLGTADAVVSCSAVWACLALRSVSPDLPVLIRINMGLLQFFHMWEDLDAFWERLAAFVASPLGAMAATSRLVAEQVYEQAGALPEHVPLVSLHLRGVAYQPRVGEALVYRCRHPAFPPFRALLARMAEEAGQEQHLAFHEDLIARHGGKALPYEFLAGFRAVVLMPHVPNSGSFSDVYAMQVPLFLPAEPHIYRWMWAYSDPFAGPGGDPRKRSRAPRSLQPSRSAAEEAEQRPPFDVFAHLEERMPAGALADRAYWFQFSEYAVLPALQRFHGAADLLSQLAGLSPERAAELSGRMRAAHSRRVHEASRWTACALARLLVAAGSSATRDPGG